MTTKLPTVSQVAALLLSGAAYAGLAYATPRSEPGQLLGLFGVALAAYAWLLRSRVPLPWGLGAALLFRLLWLPALPALSDDGPRLRWDGLLVAHGINPFRYRPDEIIADGARTILPTPAARTRALPQLQQLYRQLNSPHRYSEHPPVGQAVLGAVAGLFPDSERGFALGLRLVVLAFEAGTAALLLRLLPALGWPPARALRYLLHPLVIVELTGNLHVEAAAFCFILLAMWLLWRQRVGLSAVALGLGAATSLLPVLLLPPLARRLGGRQLLRYGVAISLTVLGLFGPFLSADVFANLGQSLKLYFSDAEFNASFYYVLRAIAARLTGPDNMALLGTGLALAAGLLVLGLAWRKQRPTLAALPPLLLLGLTAYYALAPAVRPWQLVLLVGLGTLSRFRFPLVWGGLAGLAYAVYRSNAHPENLWLLGLEYGITYAVLIWELRRSAPERPLAPAASAGQVAE